MIEPSPLWTDTGAYLSSMDHEARVLALRVRAIQEARVERQLRELDEAIVGGVSTLELRMLRDQMERQARFRRGEV